MHRTQVGLAPMRVLIWGHSYDGRGTCCQRPLKRDQWLFVPFHRALRARLWVVMLLVAGRQDKRGDRHGSFRAPRAVDPVYHLYEPLPFTQTWLRQHNAKGV
jgi:hypothetical protein